MTDETATDRRQWSEAGALYYDDRNPWTGEENRREEIVRAAETLTWHELSPGLEGPMSPMLTLRAVVEAMGPGAWDFTSRVAWSGEPIEFPDGPETATYSLVGVECKSKTGTTRFVFLDTGLSAVPMFFEEV